MIDDITTELRNRVGKIHGNMLRRHVLSSKIRHICYYVMPFMAMCGNIDQYLMMR